MVYILMNKIMIDNQELERMTDQNSISNVESIIQNASVEDPLWTRQYKTWVYKKALHTFPKWVIEWDSFFHIPTSTYQKLISFKFWPDNVDLIPLYPEWMRVNKWLTFMHWWTPYTSLVDVPEDTPAPNDYFRKENIWWSQCHVWVKMQTNLDFDILVVWWLTYTSVNIAYSQWITPIWVDVETKIIKVNRSWTYTFRNEFLLDKNNFWHYEYRIDRWNTVLFPTWYIPLNYNNSGWQQIFPSYYHHFQDLAVEKWDIVTQIVQKNQSWTLQARTLRVLYDIWITIPWTEATIIQTHSI